MQFEESLEMDLVILIQKFLILEKFINVLKFKNNNMETISIIWLMIKKANSQRINESSSYFTRFGNSSVCYHKGSK